MMNWNSCSVRQVNADRLENYIFTNLDRISNDKIYLENLVFRLNNDPEAGYRSGHELTQVCSPLSSQTLQNNLKIFLKSLAQQKGIVPLPALYLERAGGAGICPTFSKCIMYICL